MTPDPRDGMARFMDLVNGFGNGTLKIDSPAGLQRAAAALTEALGDFIANDLPGIRLKAKAAHIAVCYTPTFALKPFMEPYAQMVRDIPRDEIESKMKSAVTALASGDVLKQAGDAAQAHGTADTGELAALAKTVDALLPPCLRGFLEETAGQKGMSIEDRFTAIFNGKSQLDAEDFAQTAVSLATRLPLRAVADYTHGTLQQVSAGRMCSILKHTFNKVSAKELDNYLFFGAHAALDICRAAAQGTPLLKLQATGNMTGFVKSLSKILPAVEEAVIAQKMLPDAGALQAALRPAHSSNAPRPA